MKNSMIPIGKMAQLNHITIATLRLYDEKGLLKPVYIDDKTGYRYYSIEQNYRLDMIAYMKELGMSLSEIKNLLDSKDITKIESILIKKNEQMHQELKELKLRHDALERSIKSIETFRKAPTPKILNIQFIDRRYIFKKHCIKDFYKGNISDYEDVLLEFKKELMDNDFRYIHTYNIGTSIKKENILSSKIIADDIFIFVENQLFKERRDISIIDSGMYACIYTDKYDDEIEYAKKLVQYCKDNKYKIVGDYICEILTEFNIFDNSKRNMFMRLQIPIEF